MDKIDRSTIIIPKSNTPEKSKKSKSFKPASDTFTLDELLNTFLYVHPSDIPKHITEVERRGCILLFRAPKKMLFSFIDSHTGEECVVDYIWSDVFLEEKK